jgi:hypothetical protein
VFGTTNVSRPSNDRKDRYAIAGSSPKEKTLKTAWRATLPVLVLSLAGCEGAGGPAADDVIAQAADQRFLVEDAAQLLAPQTQLPNQTEVVEALANFWLDYFLLAHAALQDTTLGNVDVSSLVEQQTDQELVALLRNQVIQVDTAISSEELEAQFAAEQPGVRIQASHILLRLPDGATEEQTDSVRALGESLRDRILQGEDFAALAREFSQDAGSGAAGGDLGFFERGTMVKPFEDVAFALEPGEISPLVETNFGLHLIKVEGREMPSFEESQDQFRTQILNRRIATAESTFVARVVESAGVEVSTDGFESMRRIGENPSLDLTPRASQRTLVSYAGGSYGLGEFQDWIQVQNPSIHGQVVGANDEQLEGLLRNLVRGELLVKTAKDQGIELPASRRDSLSSAIRDGVRSVARELELLEVEPEAGESESETASRAVGDLLLRIVNQSQDVIPLGGVSILLRRQYGGEIFPDAFDRTVSRIQAIRAQVPPAIQSDSGPPREVQDTMPPDTTGSEE